MRYCPKCEKIYEDDDEVCMPCGVELVARLKRRESMDEVEEDYAKSLFDDDRDAMVFCGSCLREFMPGSTLCVDCKRPGLITVPRPLFEKIIGSSQIRAFRPAPEEAPRPDQELERVLEAPTPGLAAFAAFSLEGMGVDAYIGDDVLEDDPGQLGVGVFVPKDEVEAASMIIPEDLAEWFEDEEELIEEPDPYRRKLALAKSYLEIGRLVQATHQAAEAIEMRPESPEAFHFLGLVTARRGQHAKSAECFRESMERQEAPVRSESAWFFVGQSLLDEKSEPRWKGDAADEALGLLEAHCAARPRYLPAWLLQLELLDARDAKTKAAAVVDQIRKVNRFILDLEGPAKKTVERWKL